MLDHLVYATPDLDATVTELAERLCTRPVPGGSHPGLGTRNHLVNVGDGAYLEIVGPDPDQDEPPAARPFGIDDLTGARLVTWCARADRPLEDAIAASRRAGHDPGEPIEMSRMRPDGVRLSWRLTPPQLVGPNRGIVPFLIDWGSSPHPTSTLPHHVSLVQLRLETPDPEGLLVILAALDVLGGTHGIEVVEGSRPTASCLIRTADGVLGIS